MKIDAKKWAAYLAIAAVVFEGLREMLIALDVYLKSGQKSVVGAIVVMTTALVAWLKLKRPGDIAPHELDGVVNERLKAMSIPPDDSAPFDN